MRKEIENSILKVLGNPTIVERGARRDKLHFESSGRCKISFWISNKGVALFFDDAGPIIEDFGDVRNMEDLKETLDEMIMPLKNPITRTDFLVNGHIQKIRFAYTEKFNNEISSRVYQAGRYTFFDLFRKNKEEQVTRYEPWSVRDDLL